MSSGHSEPQVLYSVNNIKAYHLQDGEEQPLTPSGPQTLSLLMVPTSSPFTGLSATEPTSAAPEEDFYLHLHLPPELDQPLPATTQIYHQPPSSYLIPRWDLGPESRAFTRIEFPAIGNSPGKVTQEDVDTFETILAQCTAFLERASPPKGHEKYNPAHYGPGQGYAGSGDSKARPGQIVLVDEENGSVVGELQDGFNVVESSTIHPGSKSVYPRIHCVKVCDRANTDSQTQWKFICQRRARATTFRSTMCPRNICRCLDTLRTKNQQSFKLQPRLPG